MPFSTLRSSARGTPRGLLGSKGEMIDYSKSVSSERRVVMIAPPRSLNHNSPAKRILFMSLSPRQIQGDELKKQLLDLIEEAKCSYKGRN